MKLSQPAGQSQHELNSLELVEPFLSDLIKQRLVRSADASRAGGTELGLGHVSILRQRAVSVASADKIVLAEEQCRGDALTAAGRKRVGQVGVLIPVEESQINRAV